MLVLCFGRSHKLHAAIPFAVVGGPAGNVMGTNRELVAAASLAARAAASNRSMKISASIAVSRWTFACAIALLVAPNLPIAADARTAGLIG
jgi:hypothetical protein